MTSDEITTRIITINNEAHGLRVRLDTLVAERNELESARDRMKYTCICVRLNSDIGVYDCGAQERAGRYGLRAGGLVAGGLSALRACPRCSGSGIPVALR